MAENTLVSEGVKAAEILQAEQKARDELEALAARASHLAKEKSAGLQESEPEEVFSARSAASGGGHAASPVGDDAMAAFIGKVARQFKNNDETVRTAVAVLKTNGIEVLCCFVLCFVFLCDLHLCLFRNPRPWSSLKSMKWSGPRAPSSQSKLWCGPP